MQGQIRIIGGKWRGRKLKVPTLPNLRPTPDRVRETLFNWLAPFISGARCLDLFAGSGALGFEALSRGASEVVMVDCSSIAVNHLKEQALILKAEEAKIYQSIVPDQLRKPNQPFDIVFLDPPFKENRLIPTCFFLAENHFLKPNSYVYLEARETLEEKDLPPGWQILKSKRAGEVAYHLVRVLINSP